MSPGGVWTGVLDRNESNKGEKLKNESESRIELCYSWAFEKLIKMIESINDHRV